MRPIRAMSERMPSRDQIGDVLRDPDYFLTDTWRDHGQRSEIAVPLIYEEKDEKFQVRARKSRSEKFVFLISESHTTSEARFIPAADAFAEWKLMEPRKHDVEYYPDHNGNTFYIRVNDTGRNFRLVTAPVDDPGSAKWHEVMAQNPEIMLTNMDLFRNFLVLYQREGGLPRRARSAGRPPFMALNAMNPGFHDVREHWNPGFMLLRADGESRRWVRRGCGGGW